MAKFDQVNQIRLKVSYFFPTRFDFSVTSSCQVKQWTGHKLEEKSVTVCKKIIHFEINSFSSKYKINNTDHFTLNPANLDQNIPEENPTLPMSH